jgi:hypothetical protein
VKSAETQARQGFGKSLVECVPLNFFCFMEKSKKAVLVLWKFVGYQMGQAARQATVQMQGMRYNVYAQ